MTEKIYRNKRFIKHQENNGVDIWSDLKGYGRDPWGDSKNNEGNIWERKT